MITRRRFAQRSAAAAALAIPAIQSFSRSASAAPIVLKCSNSYVLAHPVNQRLKQAGERIKEESDGKLELRIFADSALGGDPRMVAQLRSGALEIHTGLFSYYSSLVPAVNASGLGFAFKNYDQVWAAWDGAFGDYLRAQCPEKIGAVCLDKTFDTGFRQITSNTHPVVKPADLKGMKIRVPNEENKTSLFTHLGAAPTPIQVKELYSALQTGVVDAQENGLPHIEFLKLYEVTKFCSLTNHIWDGLSIFINAKVMNRLSSGQQEILAKNLNMAALQERDDYSSMMKDILVKVEQWGMKVNTTNRDDFVTVLNESGYYKEWKGRLGDEPWSLLEKYTGSLG
jgi:tripartite ATP-independent transporter DctP family solute receptor